MKKYLVIGNPIEHSLSPQLHNYWFKKNNIDAIYDKEKLKIDDLENLILRIKEKKINGVNVTVPFKNEIISYMDELSFGSKNTMSINTIYFKNEKVIGHNTDIDGFKFAMNDIEFDLENKKILILGAGGVVPSIVFALNKMKVSKIILSNRTKNKAEKLVDMFKNITVVDWGEVPDFDMIINATSVGLNKNDVIDLNFSKLERGKFFYDVIYSPKETNFLKNAKRLGHNTENGKKMFIYQAAAAFKLWHGFEPKIDNNILKLLD